MRQDSNGTLKDSNTARQKCYGGMWRTKDSSIVGWTNSGKESKEDGCGKLLSFGRHYAPPGIYSAVLSSESSHGAEHSGHLISLFLTYRGPIRFTYNVN